MTLRASLPVFRRPGISFWKGHWRRWSLSSPGLRTKDENLQEDASSRFKGVDIEHPRSRIFSEDVSGVGIQTTETALIQTLVHSASREGNRIAEGSWPRLSERTESSRIADIIWQDIRTKHMDKVRDMVPAELQGADTMAVVSALLPSSGQSENDYLINKLRDLLIKAPRNKAFEKTRQEGLGVYETQILRCLVSREPRTYESYPQNRSSRPDESPDTVSEHDSASRLFRRLVQFEDHGSLASPPSQPSSSSPRSLRNETRTSPHTSQPVPSRATGRVPRRARDLRSNFLEVSSAARLAVRLSRASERAISTHSSSASESLQTKHNYPGYEGWEGSAAAVVGQGEAVSTELSALRQRSRFAARNVTPRDSYGHAGYGHPPQRPQPPGIGCQERDGSLEPPSTTGLMYRQPAGQGSSTLDRNIRPFYVVKNLASMVRLPEQPAPRTAVPPTADMYLPRLQHGLERVLFNPGVHPVQDLTTFKYLVPPYLRHIHSPDQIDQLSLPPFVTSSLDTKLHELGSSMGASLVGSTSSVIPILSHLYFALSRYRPVDTSVLSKDFHDMPSGFSPATRKPASSVIRPVAGGLFAIDSVKLEANADNTILMELGKSIERWLTTPKQQFLRRVLKRNDGRPQRPDDSPQAFSYLKVGDVLLRSQLDCQEPSLPGPSKTFDIKTRATLPIRIDCLNYHRYQRHRLTKLTGAGSSFEREFYDMIRSCFLKYSFQVRIGQMDGAFVAYHNTARTLGFEYVTLDEMDRLVFGSTEHAERVFDICVRLLSLVADVLISRSEGRAVQMMLYAEPNKPEVIFYVSYVDQTAQQNHSESWAWTVPRVEEVQKLRLQLCAFVDGVMVPCPLDGPPAREFEVFYKLEEEVPLPQEYMAILRAMQTNRLFNAEVARAAPFDPHLQCA